MRQPAIAASILAVLQSAQALILVPWIAPADTEIVKALPIEENPVELPPEIAGALREQTIEIECPDCPRLDSADNETPLLRFAFTIEPSDDNSHDRLLANGFELYPHPNPFDSALSAPLSVQGGDDAEASDPVPLPLGFSLGAFTRAREDPNQRLELVDVELRITEAMRRPVSSVPVVSVQLIKNANQLAMANVQVTEPRPEEPEPDCQDWICRWKAAVLKTVGRVKGGMKGWKSCGQGANKAGHGVHDGVPHRFNPHRPHGGHSSHVQFTNPHNAPDHGQHHSWRLLMRSILMSIVLPIFAGIFAGLFISIFSVLVASVLVRGYRYLFNISIDRAEQYRLWRQGKNLKASTKEAVSKEETAGLVEYQDAPPVYEEHGSDKPTQA